jgi:5,10-methylenetetrahydromethanopterin reductase
MENRAARVAGPGKRKGGFRVKTGLFVDLQGAVDAAERVRGAGRDAERRGLHSIWFQNGMGYDAAVASTIAIASTEKVEIGIGVIPAPTRHALAIAQMAATLQVLSGGRFTLGLGTSHKQTLRKVFGLEPEASPVEVMSSHLDVLLPALAGDGPLGITAAPPPQVVLGALQSKMLKLAGERTDGTVTWLTGARTLEVHIVPAVVAAAERAGRSLPRIVAIIPICVTDDPASARERVDARLARTSQLPSYAAMLRMEAATAPSDIAICGSETEVSTGIARLADAGVTELAAMVLASNEEEWARTLDALGNAAAVG